MRIYRRQRTLWRAGVIALFDVAVLCMAALVAEGSMNEEGPSAAYLLETTAGQRQGVPIVVTIEADSSVYVDGIPTTIAEMGKELADALSINGSGNVTIETAAGVPIDVVSAALSAAGMSGAKSLSLVTSQPGGGN